MVRILHVVYCWMKTGIVIIKCCDQELCIIILAKAFFHFTYSTTCMFCNSTHANQAYVIDMNYICMGVCVNELAVEKLHMCTPKGVYFNLSFVIHSGNLCVVFHKNAMTGAICI